MKMEKEGKCLLSSWSCQDEAENLLPTCRCQKQIEVDDEGKLYIFYNKGVATEIAANVLDEGWRSVWFQFISTARKFILACTVLSLPFAISL
ncbi:40S ribosomal protein S6-like protein [Cricetulus griseus]|nr:40S ribosomal protein S6-like protein [Cricetulus griseus]